MSIAAAARSIARLVACAGALLLRLHVLPYSELGARESVGVGPICGWLATTQTTPCLSGREALSDKAKLAEGLLTYTDASMAHGTRGGGVWKRFPRTFGFGLDVKRMRAG